jgi:hypothetical protein
MVIILPSGPMIASLMIRPAKTLFSRKVMHKAAFHDADTSPVSGYFQGQIIISVTLPVQSTNASCLVQLGSH